MARSEGCSSGSVGTALTATVTAAAHATTAATATAARRHTVDASLLRQKPAFATTSSRISIAFSRSRRRLASFTRLTPSPGASNHSPAFDQRAQRPLLHSQLNPVDTKPSCSSCSAIWPTWDSIEDRYCEHAIVCPAG